MMFKSEWRRRLWRYAPLIFWIGIIFLASSNAGSMSNTSRIIRPLLEFLFPSFSETQLTEIHAYIRKLAHFSFYFILGTFAARAFAGSLKEFFRKNWFVVSLFLVVAVAYLDETNQSYIASRTSSMYDVLIDAGGGFTAILLWYAGLRLKSNANKSQNHA